MKKLSLLLLACSLTSCSMIQETMAALECNRQAIDRSTCVIEENIQAINQANASIAENRRQLDAINAVLRKEAQAAK